MNQVVVSVGDDLGLAVLDSDVPRLMDAPDPSSYVAELLPWALTPGLYVLSFEWTKAPRFLGVRDLTTVEEEAVRRRQPVLRPAQARVQPAPEPLQNRPRAARKGIRDRQVQVVPQAAQEVAQALRQLGYAPADALSAAQRAVAERPGAATPDLLRRALALALKE